jgi:hypothetical protein
MVMLVVPPIEELDLIGPVQVLSTRECPTAP